MQERTIYTKDLTVSSLENYVLDLYINKVLEDNKKITLNEKKKLRKNDFELIKTQIKKDSFKIKN